MDDDSEKLVRVLDSDDPRKRNLAINELIKYGSDAVPALIRTIENRSETADAREWAVYTLGRIGDERGIDSLIYIMNERLKYEILERVPTAINMIVDSLIAKKDAAAFDRVVEKIVPTLVKSVDDKTEEFKILTSPKPPLASNAVVCQNIRYRSNVIDTLELIGDINALVAVIKELSNAKKGQDTGEVMLFAIEALGNVVTRQNQPQARKVAIDILTRVKNNPEMYKEVKSEAEKTLARIESAK